MLRIRSGIRAKSSVPASRRAKTNLPGSGELDQKFDIVGTQIEARVAAHHQCRLT